MAVRCSLHVPAGFGRFAATAKTPRHLRLWPWFRAQVQGNNLKILVTGAAGFIGMHVSQILLGRGDTVVGIDNLNDYYDPQL